MGIISTPYEVKPYDKERWVLQIDSGYYIISKRAKELLEILTLVDDLDSARKLSNKRFFHDFTTDEFTVFYKKVFERIPIDGSALNEPRERQKSYINFQVKIMGAENAKRLAFPFQLLFSPKLFWVLFCVLVVLSIVFLPLFQQQNTKDFPIFSFVIFYFISAVFHEIGHIAACSRFTGKNGEMGLGIYLIFPVFYSDISSIWMANKQLKAIANLAGVYMQFIFAAVVLLLNWFIFSWQYTELFVSLLLTLCFIQLIPFIRSDGYWLLSDLTGTHNLHRESRRTALGLLKRNETQFKITTKNVFLLIYGFLNLLIFGYFIFYQLIFKFGEIIGYPKELFIGIRSIIQEPNSDKLLSLFKPMIILFYFIVINYGIRYSKKIVNYF